MINNEAKKKLNILYLPESYTVKIHLLYTKYVDSCSQQREQLVTPVMDLHLLLPEAKAAFGAPPAHYHTKRNLSYN